MQLSEKILSTINTTGHRVRIAAAMGCGELTIRMYIKRNDPKLTQYAALQVIRKIAKENNITESEILTEHGNLVR